MLNTFYQLVMEKKLPKNIYIHMGFPGDLDDKKFACSVGDLS